jgi:hypothetical protein
MILPHELRVGDVIELAGSAWRVVHKPRTRTGVKSLALSMACLFGAAVVHGRPFVSQISDRV